ncbi:MAG: superoxide dismutase [Nanoarchaeota archaeon]
MTLHTLPPLVYAFDSLEPFIDAKTMEIHYTKHHQAYIDKLNSALEKYPSLQNLKVEELLTDNLKIIPDEIKTPVKNHAGGHLNHSFFWPLLKKGMLCEGKILAEIEKNFGSLATFKEKFNASALSLFGSGWCWLILNNGKLEILATSNQDSPISQKKIPILGIDLWEHAYYLKYMNKRADYISAFWSVINWSQVEKNLQKAHI